MALWIYIWGFVAGKTIRMSGNHLYDFFMGSWLNPRIGSLDLKMWAEIRVSWSMLFLISVSAAVKQYQVYGAVSTPMWFILLAHFLYANACMKGEECIPTTWDIFHEKYGWMLIFWNLCGVPFTYSLHSVFLLKHTPEEMERSPLYMGALFAFLLGAYYLWDSANSQKNHYRMQQAGSWVPRPWAFPQLPWRTLHNPKTLESGGKTLLVDGWNSYARKIHYTADSAKALSWGLATGVGYFLPYYYYLFLTSFLITRALRDEVKMAEKYKETWAAYVEAVPYRFVPWIY